MMLYIEERLIDACTMLGILIVQMWLIQVKQLPTPLQHDTFAHPSREPQGRYIYEHRNKQEITPETQ
jgi:hypothetical protein